MKNNNVAAIEDLIKGKQIQCSEHANGVGKIKIEDLSLYMDVVMVRDRIWAPESLRHAFFNNLHLGYRGVDMMKRLALRSVYWSGMSQDLHDFFNECYQCSHNMKVNKEPEELPEEETCRPFECISMDGFETDSKEHGLAVIDRHTGYVWARNTGEMNTGTARKMKQVIQETVASGISSMKRLKTDGAKNLCLGAVEELCKEFNIV